MANAFELVFKAILERSNITTGLNALKGQVETFTNSIKKHGILGTLTSGFSKSAPEVSKLTGAFSALVGVGAAVGAGFGAVQAALEGVVAVAKTALHNFDHFEQASLQIARFTGSIEEAHKVLKELDALGEELSTPDEQLAQAYTILRLIGGEAMATTKNLRMIADAAAAGRGDVEGLAQAFAIVESSIKSGDGMGRFGMRLARVGAISFEAKDAIDSLAESGQTAKALELFNKEFSKFAGSAEMKGKTISGATERLKDAFGDLFKELAKPFGGTFTQGIDSLTKAIKMLEPLAKFIGTAFAIFAQTIRTAGEAMYYAVDAVVVLSHALGMLFGNADAGKKLQERLEAIAKRTRDIRDGWRSISTGSLNDDKVKPIENEGQGLQYEEGAKENLKNIRKLTEEIAQIKRKAAEDVLSDEEKILHIDGEIARAKRQGVEASKKAVDAEVKGEGKITELQQAALQIAKQEVELTKKREEIERKIVETKRKAAQEEAKRAKEIYKNIEEMQKKRSYEKGSNTWKLASNAAERGNLEAQKSKQMAELQALEDKISPEDEARLSRIDDLKNNLAKLEAKDQSLMTPEEVKADNIMKGMIQSEIKSLTDNLTEGVDSAVAAANQSDIETKKREIADTDQSINDNQNQREDLMDDMGKSVKEAMSRQEDYKIEKLFSDLESIRESEKTTAQEKKRAAEQEIKLRESLADKMENEAKSLEMMGDKAGAIDKQTEAMKMRDSAEALRQSSITKSPQLTYGEGGGGTRGIAANMLGIQYQQPQQDQTRYLANIDTTMKNVEVAIKANTDVLAKPIIVSRFL